MSRQGLTVTDFRLCPKMQVAGAELAQFIRLNPKALYEEEYGFIYDFLVRFGIKPYVIEDLAARSRVTAIIPPSTDVSASSTTNAKRTPRPKLKVRPTQESQEGGISHSPLPKQVRKRKQSMNPAKEAKKICSDPASAAVEKVRKRKSSHGGRSTYTQNGNPQNSITQIQFSPESRNQSPLSAQSGEIPAKIQIAIVQDIKPPAFKVKHKAEQERAGNLKLVLKRVPNLEKPIPKPETSTSTNPDNPTSAKAGKSTSTNTPIQENFIITNQEDSTSRNSENSTSAKPERSTATNPEELISSHPEKSTAKTSRPKKLNSSKAEKPTPAKSEKSTSQQTPIEPPGMSKPKLLSPSPPIEVPAVPNPELPASSPPIEPPGMSKPKLLSPSPPIEVPAVPNPELPASSPPIKPAEMSKPKLHLPLAFVVLERIPIPNPRPAPPEQPSAAPPATLEDSTPKGQGEFGEPGTGTTDLSGPEEVRIIIRRLADGEVAFPTE